MMTMHTTALLNILRNYIQGGEPRLDLFFERWQPEDWEVLYKMAQRQGVAAIVYNTIAENLNGYKIARNTKFSWALLSENIQKRSAKHWAVANDISKMWGDCGITTVVLKGFGLGRYYPTPWLRECGDFDCYLFGDYPKGVELALSKGAKFLHKDYKHTQLLYRGVAIEVHEYFTSFRGDRTKHRLENDLHELITSSGVLKPVGEESCILSASPTFTTCYFLYHTQFHFLIEGVKLRHMLDWILFVKSEKDNIDWEYVVAFCNRYKLTRFAEALNAVVAHYFGIELAIPIVSESIYRDRVMSDILMDAEGVSNKSGWSRRVQLLKNTSQTRWKYELIDSTFIRESVKRIYYLLFSKDKLIITTHKI